MISAKGLSLRRHLSIVSDRYSYSFDCLTTTACTELYLFPQRLVVCIRLMGADFSSESSAEEGKPVAASSATAEVTKKKKPTRNTRVSLEFIEEDVKVYCV